MTEATPLSLRYDGIMSRTIWAFRVDELSFECRSILLTASKLCLYFLYLSVSPFTCLPLFFPPLLFVHILALCQFLVPLDVLSDRHPSFWPAISRSDPFVRIHCIFNPDLDNGTVTVIFAPGLFPALRPFMSLTLCFHPPTPPLPIIAELPNAEQCYTRNK